MRHNRSLHSLNRLLPSRYYLTRCQDRVRTYDPRSCSPRVLLPPGCGAACGVRNGAPATAGRGWRLPDPARHAMALMIASRQVRLSDSLVIGAARTRGVEVGQRSISSSALITILAPFGRSSVRVRTALGAQSHPCRGISRSTCYLEGCWRGCASLEQAMASRRPRPSRRPGPARRSGFPSNVTTLDLLSVGSQDA